MSSSKKHSDTDIIQAALRWTRARDAYRARCNNPDRSTSFTRIAREYAEAEQALAESIEAYCIALHADT